MLESEIPGEDGRARRKTKAAVEIYVRRRRVAGLRASAAVTEEMLSGDTGARAGVLMAHPAPFPEASLSGHAPVRTAGALRLLEANRVSVCSQ